MTTFRWRYVLVAGMLAIVAACSRGPEQPRGSAATPGAASPAGTPQAQAPAASQSNGGVETIQLVSDFLTQAQYQAATRSLTLSFKDGSEYRYMDVPPTLFDGLRKYPKDAGVVFNKSIRKQFKFTRLKGGTSVAPKRPAASANARPPITCPKEMTRREVTSVVLDAVAYDPATRCLMLYFDSKDVYKYGNVPAEVYKQLLAPNANFNALFPRRKNQQKYPFEHVR